MENKKVFSKYIMNYDQDYIINVTDAIGKKTMFSYTFYSSNKDLLDSFKNIDLFVKSKKKSEKKNNIIINLDDYTISYSGKNEKVSENDLKKAFRIVKNELSEKNQDIAREKALLIKYLNDIKTLEELKDAGLCFDKEIEETKSKIESVNKNIERLLNEAEREG